MSSTEVLYFVHISDTHIGSSSSYARHGHKSFPCAAQLVEIINNLPTQPDFVIHTGDVVADPSPAAYKLAAKIFSRLDMPIYYVTGNHDKAKDIRRYLPMGAMQMKTDASDLLSYVFDVKGYRFLAVDARGPDEIDPHGLLSEEQMDIVREEATEQGLPLTLFMHFPINKLNSIWMDAYMLAINGDELHEALLPAKDRLRGVFYGHVHQNMQTWRDGILYVSVASTFSQFTAWPQDKAFRKDEHYLPGFNFVHMMPQQTIIHQHLFPRPE